MQLNEDDFARLNELDTIANAVLSESDFTKRLLPHLVPDPTNAQRRDMSIWLAVAGQANRMIDVVSDRDRSKVLFTVPPLLSQTPMVIRAKSTSPDTDISEITAVFTAELSNVPSGMLIDSFVNKLMELSYSPTDAIGTVYSLMWGQIYKRYNIPLELLFGDDAPRVEKMLSGRDIEPTEPGAVNQSELSEFDDDDFDPA